MSIKLAFEIRKKESEHCHSSGHNYLPTINFHRVILFSVFFSSSSLWQRYFDFSTRYASYFTLFIWTFIFPCNRVSLNEILFIQWEKRAKGRDRHKWNSWNAKLNHFFFFLLHFYWFCPCVTFARFNKIFAMF